MKILSIILLSLILTCGTVEATNYFVDSTTGDNGDNGTTMDLAFATLKYALDDFTSKVAGDFIFVRRLHNEIPTTNIVVEDDGTAASPITVMGWPRAAHSISSADFVNGNTSVNVDDNDMDREKHQGRFLTAPDGEDYLITRVVDTATIILDRPYVNGTAGNQAATIKADEDWVDDMQAVYGFDDSGTIKEIHWDADADDLPLLDWNETSFNLIVSGDNYFEFKNLDVQDSTDTSGAFQLIGSGYTALMGCLFKNVSGVSTEILNLSSNTVFIDRCILEGGGNSGDFSQSGIVANATLIMRNSAIYNMGNHGIELSNFTGYFCNVNIGVELANQDDDISVLRVSQVKAIDVKLGGTNGYILFASALSQAKILIENYNKQLGAHKTWYLGGTWEKSSLLTGGTTPNKKLSDYALKITPDLTGYQFLGDYAEEIFSHEFDATTDDLTYKYWIFNNAADTLNDGDAKGSIWLECQYIDSYGDAVTEYTQCKVYSTENTIANAGGDTDWDFLSVTSIAPAVASRVRIKLFCRHYHATGTIYVDPAVVIS